MSTIDPSSAPLVQEMVRPTTILDVPRLAKRLGVEMFLATETFQHTGSFKFRAAYNVARSVPQPHIIAASSGNFGQALAYACRLLRKRCTVVMPDNSARVKVEAVREYGGEVAFVDVRVQSRKSKVEEVAAAAGDAHVTSAYDDPLVISGNATLGLELARLRRGFDCVLAPVGGGGLTSGLVQGLSGGERDVEVHGAEPLLGNDVARSLREGRIISNTTEPATIADGARTVSMGEHNWAILRTGLKSVIEVSEENIAAGVRLLFELANLKAEPTGSLAIGALLSCPELFRGRTVCCVISGGNVGADIYREILDQKTWTPPADGVGERRDGEV